MNRHTHPSLGSTDDGGSISLFGCKLYTFGRDQVGRYSPSHYIHRYRKPNCQGSQFGFCSGVDGRHKHSENQHKGQDGLDQDGPAFVRVETELVCAPFYIFILGFWENSLYL